MTRVHTLGLSNSTVIAFASDNGAFPTSGGLNVPYAGEKGTYLEGGVRTPALIWGLHNLPGCDAGAWETKRYSHIFSVVDW